MDGIDPFLVQVLSGGDARLAVLRIEKELIGLESTGIGSFIDFHTTSSYHSLCVHKVAEYYCWDHLSCQDEHGNRTVKVVHSGAPLPSTSLAQLPVQCLGEPNVVRKVQIMKRNKDSQVSNLLQGIDKNFASSEAKDESAALEKEQAYLEARAKIFQGMPMSAEIDQVPAEDSGIHNWVNPEEAHLYDRNLVVRSEYLLVTDLPMNLKNYQIDMLLDPVKALGGIILWQDYILVKFPTVEHAQIALDTVRSPDFTLSFSHPSILVQSNSFENFQ